MSNPNMSQMGKTSSKKRYTPEVRAIVRGRISTLKRSGHTAEEIMLSMNADGYTCPQGGRLKDWHIKNQLVAIRKEEEKLSQFRKKKNSASEVKEIPVAANKPKENDGAPMMVRVILASDENSETKINLLTAYYGLQ